MQRAHQFLLRHARALAPLLIALWLLCGMGIWQHWWGAPGNWGYMVAASVLAWLLVRVWARWQREKWLRERPLPMFLRRKLRSEFPHLSSKDVELVERGLRQFFVACLRSNRQFVAMPSKVVDAMWHEFILHTKAYQEWCTLGLGWFLHHTPAQVLGVQAAGNDGLRRAWYWACRDETIRPAAPTRLPLLFALDAKLGIANGFHYQADCNDIQKKSKMGGDGGGSVYCGTSFSDSSYSGDSGSFGGSEVTSHGGDSSTDSGSDGGGGGGCGGGGD